MQKTHTVIYALTTVTKTTKRQKPGSRQLAHGTVKQAVRQPIKGQQLQTGHSRPQNNRSRYVYYVYCQNVTCRIVLRVLIVNLAIISISISSFKVSGLVSVSASWQLRTLGPYTSIYSHKLQFVSVANMQPHYTMRVAQLCCAAMRICAQPTVLLRQNRWRPWQTFGFATDVKLEQICEHLLAASKQAMLSPWDSIPTKANFGP